jgi:DNA-binding NarL/FixJ family response regulator
VAVRLLIADDNPTGRNLLRALLESRDGWQVCGEAENGLEAAAKCSELKPDVVILDLAMPLMDGLQAARAISAASPAIPLLLYTMHDFAGLDVEAKKVGIRRVISKTDPADALLAAIDEELKSAAPQATVGVPQALSATASASSSGATDAPATNEVDPNSKLN